MTIDERKMTIAYADLLNMQELVQHILRMDADDMFKPETRKTFAQIALQLDVVVADVGHYVSRHTEFNEDMKSNDGKCAKYIDALRSVVQLEQEMNESINKAGYATGGEAGHYFYKAVKVAKEALDT
jgi:hypothetical protein